MKRFLTIGFVFHVLMAGAQWSADLSAPLTLSDIATDGKGLLHVLEDGSGGWYVLWRAETDLEGGTELWGQHVDADGQRLWGPEGRVILSPTGATEIMQYDARLMADGTILIGYSDSYTGAYAQRLDPNGDALWPTLKTLMVVGANVPNVGVIHEVGEVHFAPTGNNAWVFWLALSDTVMDNYVAYPDYLFYQKIDMGGAVLANGNTGMLADPQETMLWSEAFPDQTGGAMVFSYTDADLLRATHVSSSGTITWGPDSIAPVSSSSIGYAEDGTGAVLPVYAYNNDIYASRVQPTGNVAWTGQVCSESHVQTVPVGSVKNGDLYTAWLDARPPANLFDLYAQKYDLNGNPAWTSDGIMAIHFPSSPAYGVPTPGVVPGADGSVLLALSNLEPGTMVQRVLADGTLGWASPQLLCTSELGADNGQIVYVPDGADGLVAFWHAYPGAIFGAKLNANGLLAGIQEQAGAKGQLPIQPSPTDGPVTVGLPDGQQVRSAQVFNAEGRTLELPMHFNPGRIDMDASALPNGVYLVQVATDAGLMIGRFAVNH